MSDRLVLHMVSHTHWDREWYLSYQPSRRRFVKLVDRLLRLMEEKPGYERFTMDGQVLVVKDYLEIRPQERDKIAQLTRQGRLFIGPWYSQPNPYLVSGESLIRNLLLGSQECEALGGVMKVCYLPDAFGFIPQLPQIARGFEMEDVVVWRGIPRGSQTTFEWRGSDGTVCLAHYMLGGYANAMHLPLSAREHVDVVDCTAMERKGLSRRIDEIIERLGPRTTTPHLLLMNGVDHQFPQAYLPEIIQEINKTKPGVQALHSSLPAYIHAVRQRHLEAALPYEQVSGELRDPREGCILPGSLSTRADVKATNRRIEGLFERWTEPFATFAWLTGWPYPGAEIRQAWEYLLQNHAHDSLACASLDPVYHQVLTRFEWAEELGRDIADECLQVLCNCAAGDAASYEEGLPLVVFNPLCWAREEVISATVDVPIALKLRNPCVVDDGKVVPVVVNAQRRALTCFVNPYVGICSWIPVDRYDISFLADEIPSCGYRVLRLADAPAPRQEHGTLLRNQVTIENEFLVAVVAPNGTVNLRDKRTGREYRSLLSFEDSGEAGNGFEQKAPPIDRVVTSVGAQACIKVVEDTALRATLQVDITMDLPQSLTDDRSHRSDTSVPCHISSRISLCVRAPRLDVMTTIENSARDHRLCVVMPTGIKAESSWAEEPFDVVARPIALPDLNGSLGDTSPCLSLSDEEFSATHPQLSFVDVSDGKEGLLVANKGIYSYEVADNADRRIALTLLRCTDKLYRGQFMESEDLRIPEAQCLGTYTFDYSLIPHSGTWHAAHREAYNYQFPMRVVRRKTLEEETLPDFPAPLVRPELPAACSFVEIASDCLFLTAVKKHESRQTVVIRLVNLRDEEIHSRVRLNIPGVRIAKAWQTNLKEDRKQELAVGTDDCIDVVARGKGLLTLEVSLA